MLESLNDCLLVFQSLRRSRVWQTEFWDRLICYLYYYWKTIVYKLISTRDIQMNEIFHLFTSTPSKLVKTSFKQNVSLLGNTLLKFSEKIAFKFLIIALNHVWELEIYNQNWNGIRFKILIRILK